MIKIEEKFVKRLKIARKGQKSSYVPFKYAIKKKKTEKMYVNSSFKPRDSSLHHIHTDLCCILI